jgi:hypothetical protein
MHVAALRPPMLCNSNNAFVAGMAMLPLKAQ